jgi:cell shape-determining protein MreD
MVREVYRALNFVIFIFFGLLVCSFQSVFLRIPFFSWLQLDLLLLIVVYIGIYRSLMEGALLVLVLSRIAEVHSGSPAGLLSFCYMSACFTIYFTKEFFLFGTPFSSILLGVIGGILFKVCYLVLSFQVGALENVWFNSLQFLFPYLLGLAAFSRPIFSLGAKIDIVTNFREISEAKRLAGEDF